MIDLHTPFRLRYQKFLLNPELIITKVSTSSMILLSVAGNPTGLLRTGISTLLIVCV